MVVAGVGTDNEDSRYMLFLGAGHTIVVLQEDARNAHYSEAVAG
jgi:hypothetical protein